MMYCVQMSVVLVWLERCSLHSWGWFVKHTLLPCAQFLFRITVVVYCWPNYIYRWHLVPDAWIRGCFPSPCPSPSFRSFWRTFNFQPLNLKLLSVPRTSVKKLKIYAQTSSIYVGAYMYTFLWLRLSTSLFDKKERKKKTTIDFISIAWRYQS